VIRIATEVGLKIPASESLVPDNQETRRVRQNIRRQMLRNPTFTLDTPFELPDLDYDELNFLEESDEDKPR
jgi:hypothetical protein